MLPLFPPLQLIFTDAPIVAVAPPMLVTEAAVVAVHPFASVIVAVYPFAARPVTVMAVLPELQL